MNNYELMFIIESRMERYCFYYEIVKNLEDYYVFNTYNDREDKIKIMDKFYHYLINKREELMTSVFKNGDSIAFMLPLSCKYIVLNKFSQFIKNDEVQDWDQSVNINWNQNYEETTLILEEELEQSKYFN